MKTPYKKLILPGLAILLLGLGLGWLLFSGTKKEHTHQAETHNETWTCSMHPQIRSNEPGQCPICGMDLIPVSEESGNENPEAIKMSPTAMQLANVQTSIVSKGQPVKSVQLTGKVQVNEQEVASQTSHLSGRIEKLLINTTGEYIQRGQVIAYVYSPELITAQEELFQAAKMKDTNPLLFRAAKDKLKNWKLTEKQIEAILASGIPSETFPILSDINGVVMAKRVNMGDYIKQGAVLYEVADLSQVWVLFDVYESDMPWVKVGDEITYTVPSIPGKDFTGKISFIDPVINPKTRVAKARIVVNNKGLALKPEMFVNGSLKSPLNNEKSSIIIPKSAIMWTGEKSVVYIKAEDENTLDFTMREVRLGTSLGEAYVVKEGLREGEEIVTNGTFSIDAAAQLAGKPSMMNQPPSGLSNLIKPEGKKALQELVEKYLNLKNSLVKDDFEGAKQQASALYNSLRSVDMKNFEGEAHMQWMDYHKQLDTSLEHVAHWENIETIRKAFITLSNTMISLVEHFELNNETLYVQQCPMANNDKGADWISAEEEIKNPYFGSSMLRCGSVKKTLK